MYALLMILQIPMTERPRERCLEQGPGCLSLRECLAILLGSGPRGLGCMGLATQILKQSGDGMSANEEERAFFIAMETYGPSHLRQIRGLGPSGRARLLIAFELAKRYRKHRDLGPSEPQSPQNTSVAKICRKSLEKVSPHLRTETREWLGFVPIHRADKIGDLCIIEYGVRTHVNTEPAEIFARILALRPLAFILFHNHPSGNLDPSSPDLDLTTRVRVLAQQLGIELIGHWIVTSQSERWIDPYIAAKYEQ